METRERKLEDGTIVKERAYIIHDVFGDISYWCPEKSCVFCNHCSDVYYDYSHGPYGFACDKHDGDAVSEGCRGNCKDFEGDEE